MADDKEKIVPKEQPPKPPVRKDNARKDPLVEKAERPDSWPPPPEDNNE